MRRDSLPLEIIARRNDSAAHRRRAGPPWCLGHPSAQGWLVSYSPDAPDEPPTDLFQTGGREVAQLRERLEHLERITLTQAVENEELANENERLRVAIEALSAPHGIRAILRIRSTKLDS